MVIIIMFIPSELLMNKFVYHYNLSTLIKVTIKQLFIGILLAVGTIKLCQLNDKKFK